MAEEIKELIREYQDGKIAAGNSCTKQSRLPAVWLRPAA